MFKYLYKVLNFIIPQYRRCYLKKKVKLHRRSQIVHPKNLNIGEYVYIGPHCFINAEGGISIGCGTIIAPDVVILSSTHSYNTGQLMPYDIYDEHRPVTIGKGVWIGYRAMICPGVTISDGAVLAMGAVVTKSVAEGAVVGGNPAKDISHREGNEFIELIAQQQFLQKKYFLGDRPKEPLPTPMIHNP